MRSVNKITLMGYLGRDPETRTLPSGSKVVDFSVATSEPSKDKEGNQIELTTWFRVEAWDRLGDVAEQYLKKGDPVYIEGRLRMEEYTDREGKQRTTLRVRALDLNLISNRSDGEARGQAAQSAPSRPAQQPASASVVAESGGEDDLPF